MKKIRILHASTAHPPHDPRLVYRVMPSLADDYKLIALIPDGPQGLVDGIRYLRLPFYRRVLTRFLRSHYLVLWHALRLRPSLLHIYDPELLPVAYLLQLLFRFPVIYEVHENLYKKMEGKALSQGRLLTRFFAWFDAIARQRFYLIFTEHGYLDTYSKLAKPHAVVYNYPLLPSLEPFRQPYAPDYQKPRFFYIGWMSFERAFDTIMAGLALLKQRYPNFEIHLFGERTFTDADLEQLPGFSVVRNNLHFYGYTSQQSALPYAAHATAGLALLKPVDDHTESYTTKMFEYMALELPVITSDFPLYRDVVERHGCGFCISPYDPVQLADALIYLIEHPDEARAMGQRGRRAVESEYNWSSEAQKLRTFYNLIFNDGN